MKKLSLLLMLIFAANALAGVHVEDFATTEWTSGDWVQFGSDTDTGVMGDLDYMTATPNTTMTAAYDWLHGSTSMGGNANDDGSTMLNTGINVGTDTPTYQEFYLHGSTANPVRWEGVDVVGYGDAAWSACEVTISLIASDSTTVLYSTSLTAIGNSYDVLDFGSVAYDTSMTLRLEDQQPMVDGMGDPTGQTQQMSNGFVGFDQLAWSEVPEPVSIVLLGLGTLLLRKRR